MADYRDATVKHPFVLGIVQAMIVGTLSAGLSVWGTTLVLTERMAGQQKQIDETRIRVDKLYSDLYLPAYSREQSLRMQAERGQP